MILSKQKGNIDHIAGRGVIRAGSRPSNPPCHGLFFFGPQRADPLER